MNKLRYHCEGFTEQYLSGGSAVVAYRPENVSMVWLLENGNYTEFSLIDSGFRNMDLAQVQEIQANQKTVVKNSSGILNPTQRNCCKYNMVWMN